MNTTINLVPSRPPPAIHRWRPTLLLGAVLSVVGVAVAVALRLAAHVPPLPVAIAVAAVGFTLSWRSAGHHDPVPDAPAPDAHDNVPAA